MSKPKTDFREVWTHDAAYRLIRDLITAHGGKVLSHRYESSSPDGKVLVDYKNATHSIRYGLPDDRDELKRMVLHAMEDPSRWKSMHTRDF